MIMKLNKEEQKFIAENIQKFDVVTGITVDEFEVRIHGAYLNINDLEVAIGSAAIYRTKDIKAIYSHAHAKCVEAEKNLKKIRGRTANV